MHKRQTFNPQKFGICP